MNRRRKWELKQLKKHLCRNCANPAVTALFCLRHAIKSREAQRIRQGAKRRNNSLSYQLERQFA